MNTSAEAATGGGRTRTGVSGEVGDAVPTSAEVSVVIVATTASSAKGEPTTTRAEVPPSPIATATLPTLGPVTERTRSFVPDVSVVPTITFTRSKLELSTEDPPEESDVSASFPTASKTKDTKSKTAASVEDGLLTPSISMSTSDNDVLIDLPRFIQPSEANPATRTISSTLAPTQAPSLGEQWVINLGPILGTFVGVFGALLAAGIVMCLINERTAKRRLMNRTKRESAHVSTMPRQESTHSSSMQPVRPSSVGHSVHGGDGFLIVEQAVSEKPFGSRASTYFQGSQPSEGGATVKHLSTGTTDQWYQQYHPSQPVQPVQHYQQYQQYQQYQEYQDYQMRLYQYQSLQHRHNLQQFPDPATPNSSEHSEMTSPIEYALGKRVSSVVSLPRAHSLAGEYTAVTGAEHQVRAWHAVTLDTEGHVAETVDESGSAVTLAQ
ncbi:hypothetical protein BJ741DRAFT_604306 [Chytriomyces cf. hyalinus JEL632]|nr:hypothetical protein BJ741DRAFT_604306 [Chytriomyces cf. hyalinus JEL632]